MASAIDSGTSVATMVEASVDPKTGNVRVKPHSESTPRQNANCQMSSLGLADLRVKELRHFKLLGNCYRVTFTAMRLIPDGCPWKSDGPARWMESLT